MEPAGKVTSRKAQKAKKAKTVHIKTKEETGGREGGDSA